jgi:hypothetical protein
MKGCDYVMEKQIYYDYLEELRQFGVTNMFGAVPYLMREFDLSHDEASKILSDWMGSYKQPE